MVLQAYTSTVHTSSKLYKQQTQICLLQLALTSSKCKVLDEMKGIIV